MQKVVTLATGINGDGRSTIILDSLELPMSIDAYPNGSVYMLDIKYSGRNLSYYGEKAELTRAYIEIDDFIKAAVGKENE